MYQLFVLRRRGSLRPIDAGRFPLRYGAGSDFISNCTACGPLFKGAFFSSGLSWLFDGANGTTAVFFLTEEVADFVHSGLFRIGRIPVSVESPREDELFRTISYEERSGTVASLRLDCIAAFIMGKSRTQACSLIAAGLVSVNRIPVTQPAKQVAPGDQIVIRGFGKCYLGTQIRTTRKDRLSITIQKLV